MFKVLRFLCYTALVIVLIGLLSLVLPFAFDLCSTQSGGIVNCTSELYRKFYEFGFTVVMMSIFTGVPGILAIGGVVFLFKDIAHVFGGKGA